MQYKNLDFSKVNSNLESVSRVPFNNFIHFFDDFDFNLNRFLGVDDFRSFLGGNCIYKSCLAADVLKSTHRQVYCVVGLGGFHHALLSVGECGQLFFFDPCLFMPSAINLASEFECVHTIFSSSHGDVNFVAIDSELVAATNVVWRFSSGVVSKSFYFNYDLSATNLVPMSDSVVEFFKPVPNSLIFRYLDSNDNLMHLSFFIKERECYLSKAFSSEYLSVSDLSVFNRNLFLRDVGIEISMVVDTMRKACEFMLISKQNS